MVFVHVAASIFGIIGSYICLVALFYKLRTPSEITASRLSRAIAIGSLTTVVSLVVVIASGTWLLTAHPHEHLRSHIFLAIMAAFGVLLFVEIFSFLTYEQTKLLHLRSASAALWTVIFAAAAFAL